MRVVAVFCWHCSDLDRLKLIPLRGSNEIILFFEFRSGAALLPPRFFCAFCFSFQTRIFRKAAGRHERHAQPFKPRPTFRTTKRAPVRLKIKRTKCQSTKRQGALFHSRRVLGGTSGTAGRGSQCNALCNQFAVFVKNRVEPCG